MTMINGTTYERELPPRHESAVAPPFLRTHACGRGHDGQGKERFHASRDGA